MFMTSAEADSFLWPLSRRRASSLSTEQEPESQPIKVEDNGLDSGHFQVSYLSASGRGITGSWAASMIWHRNM